MNNVHSINAQFAKVAKHPKLIKQAKAGDEIDSKHYDTCFAAHLQVLQELKAVIFNKKLGADRDLPPTWEGFSPSRQAPDKPATSAPGIAIGMAMKARLLPAAAYQSAKPSVTMRGGLLRPIVAPVSGSLSTGKCGSTPRACLTNIAAVASRRASIADMRRCLGRGTTFYMRPWSRCRRMMPRSG